MMQIVYIILWRELKIAYRQRANVMHAWIFFLMIVSLFPLALNPVPSILSLIAPAIIWVGILLMTVLSLERAFRQDVDQGLIEQWRLAPISFEWLIFIKLLIQWMVNYLPLFLFMPLLALGLHLSLHSIGALMWSLLLGTPSLWFIGAIFTALTVQLRHSGLLLALLALPFYVPILIFAAGVVSNAMNGLLISGPLALLGAILALALPLAPLTTAAALKIGMA